MTNQSGYPLLERVIASLLPATLCLMGRPRHGIAVAVVMGVGLFLLMSWKKFSSNRPLADAVIGSLGVPIYALLFQPNRVMASGIVIAALCVWMRYATVRAKAVGVA